MNWIFIQDIVFYAILGIVTFVPLVAIVASLRKVSFKIARKQTFSFLETWANLAPKEWLQAIFTIAGLSGVLFLLSLGAYLFNRLGDETMPYTSKIVGHFGDRVIPWTIKYGEDWDKIRKEFRTVSGIEHDSRKWEEAKVELGVREVRLSRVLFYLFLLLFVAGIADTVGSKKFRSRGLCLLFIGMLGLAASQFLWVKRQKQFVTNLVARYETTYSSKNKGQKPELPTSYIQRIEKKSN